MNFEKSEPPGRFGFQFTGRTFDGKAPTVIPAVLHNQPIDMPEFQAIPVKQIITIAHVDGSGTAAIERPSAVRL